MKYSIKKKHRAELYSDFGWIALKKWNKDIERSPQKYKNSKLILNFRS